MSHQDPQGHHHDHGEGHDHAHGHSHGHEETCHGDEVAPLSPESQRYEMEDLFHSEAPENRHFFKVAGLVLLVFLMALALAYPFFFIKLS